MVDAAATRVVLLAREGAARDRLAAALAEAGASVALVADPLSADPQDIVAARPQAVLVALEPAVEDALERFDAVLTDPDITVIFDEAELAAQRAGWDAARWVRHLSAKLNRHDNVLPPGSEIEGDWQPSPGPLPPVRDAALDITTFAGEAQERAATVPRDDGRATGVATDDSADDFGFETLRLDDDNDDGDRVGEGMLSLIDADDNAALADAPRDDGLVTEIVFDDEDLGLAPENDDAGSGLSLVDPDDVVALERGALGSPTIAQDLDALDQRASSLSLADEDSYGHGPLRGAVLIEGGLGGPDAVRQLLGEIPEGFPRPILVHLHLDGGRYDRLVKQMQRAAKLDVALAENGQLAEPGTIYFVPPSLGLARQRASLAFATDEGASAAGLLAALPAGDCAVLFLSGSDAGLIDVAMAHAAEGALVLGQAPEECYDGIASTALIARGGETGSPAALAARLAERWPA
jgi:chemosensory pili system protein ChpB (putative protein-glutamate methylesterase)